MRCSCISKALRVLKITAQRQDCTVFAPFLTIKTSTQSISITSKRLFEEELSSSEEFLKNSFSAESMTASKIGNGVI